MSCCCHGLEDPCPFNVEQKHVHKCRPRYLDLGGHCHDSGCAGDCWTNAGTVSCATLGSDA